MRSMKQTITLSVLFIVSLVLLQTHEDRSNFAPLLVYFSISFVVYLLLVRQSTHQPFSVFITIAVVAHLTTLLSTPHLSIDYYRFLWDGEITWAGNNPFSYTPNELYQKGFAEGSTYRQELYDGIGEMSQNNYSCYPPLHQLYFLMATYFSDSLVFNTTLLKLLILITELIGAVYLVKIMQLLHIAKNRIWLLLINPLFIVEATGNVHFEGVMISFLFMAFYYLLQKKTTIGSVFFAFAIQIKLIPLLLLPFFYRFLGIARSVQFYALTILLVVLLGTTQLNASNIQNFIESLRLYFQVFEFNAFVLHYYLQYGLAETGWNMTRIYGPQLSRIAIMIIATLALYGRIEDWKTLFQRMTIAFFFYLILSSTVHPWYILPILALSIFTNYSFPIWWTYVAFFSYLFYAYESNSAKEVEWMMNIEYFTLFALFIYELIRKRSPLKFLRIDAFTTPS